MSIGRSMYSKIREQRQRRLDVGACAEQRLDREQQPCLQRRERHHDPDRKSTLPTNELPANQ